MKVVNWCKWTRFKKRISLSLLLTGTFISFGMEDGSILYGIWGATIAGCGVLILNTIRENEW